MEWMCITFTGPWHCKKLLIILAERCWKCFNTSETVSDGRKGHKLIYNLIYHAWLMKYEKNPWNFSSREASGGRHSFIAVFPWPHCHCHVIVMNNLETRGLNRMMSSQQTIKYTWKAKDYFTWNIYVCCNICLMIMLETRNKVAS